VYGWSVAAAAIVSARGEARAAEVWAGWRSLALGETADRDSLELREQPTATHVE
jgi:hypothetical protein